MTEVQRLREELRALDAVRASMVLRINAARARAWRRSHREAVNDARREVRATVAAAKRAAAVERASED
jgi:hypothetical protein